MANANGMIQPSIFEDLQRKIDEDVAVKDALRDIVQTLEKQDRATQATLSRSHSTPTAELASIISAAEENIGKQVQSIQQLSATASKYAYYRYNYSWTHQMQGTTNSILLCGYLGGFGKSEAGQLLTIEEVGQVMNVPVNLKNIDAFHLTIEEYLLALISMVDELSRLARNSVTLGDYRRPLQISKFIKDLHAGFQILNLKNDALRKRSDGIKYRVKEVEDVVYDLSLRGLLPRD
ncbi:Translin [Polychaeton citri CBS 116435]|uniref:Translin n=1 Tax=Polychaeton citri CBS 116435 TaxID=1314669 RepID=A0A9P4QBI2_9PEZI|nr:Translin [Polychaeton citri CBS 116435]